MKLSIIFFFLLFFIPQVSSIGVSGGPMPATLYYEYGTQEEHTYKFGTNSFTQDYIIDIREQEGFDITQFMTVEPDHFKNMPSNTGAEFKVKFDFYEESIPPGRHEALVIIKETETSGGGAVGASAQVGVRFRVISLFPTEFLQLSLRTKDANVGEDIEVTSYISNWGIPRVDDAKVTYRIYDSSDNFIKEKSSEMLSIESKEKKPVVTMIPSEGMLADDYKVIAKLTYSDEEKSSERTVRLGTKNVKILEMTDEFLPEAINKVEVNVESGWNDVIDEIKGKVDVYYGNEKVSEFSLIEISLNSWDKKPMFGYFETNGLELGEYEARVKLEYGEEESNEKFDIVIADSSETETVEQIPGSFSVSGLVSVQNLIILLLIIVLGMNVWYLIDRRKK